MLVDDPLAEGSEIVADVRRAGRLHPGEDPLHRKKDSGRGPEARDFAGRWVSDRRRLAPDNLARVGYEVHTDVFEGPFDLLLRLITEQRVDLYEVVLSDIVDAFLAEVEQMQRLDLEVADRVPRHRGHPRRAQVPAAVARARGVRRGELRPCSKSATTCSPDWSSARPSPPRAPSSPSRSWRASRSWPRLAGLDERFEGLQPDLLVSVDPDQLRQAALRALETRPVPHVETDHVLVDEVTVAEIVEALCRRLPGASPTTFRELTAAAATRMEIVVHFLGLLELYKQGLVELDQATTFGELKVSWTGERADAYAPSDDEGASQQRWRERARMSLANLDYSG